MIEIQLPDGTIAEFPDGTSQEVIKGAMQKRFGAPQSSKPLGRTIWENIVGDDDPTTQNTGEKVGSWLNKAGEAMTLGLVGDEVSGAVAAAIPGGMGYEERRDFERQQQELLEDSNPGSAFAADLVGGLIPGLMTAGIASGPTVARTVGRAAGLGAAEGGIYGFMEGEGGFGNRMMNAGGMAGLGAGFGAAMPGLVAGAGRLGRAVADPVAGAFGLGNTGRAGRAMMQSVEKAGKTPDQLGREVSQAVADGQPEFRLMDALGQAGQRRASGVTRSGGPGSDELASFLHQRQIDQGDRVGEIVRDAFGFRGRAGAAQGTDLIPEGYEFTDDVSRVLTRPQRSAAGLSDDLRAVRSRVADGAYDAAREGAGPVDVRGAVSVIDNRIGGMQGSNITGDSIDAKLIRYRDRLIADPAPGDEISRELSDFDRVLGVKQAIQDDIGAATRAGRNNEARELSKLARELDAALEGASPDYRAANDGFRTASRVIDSVDTGAEMALRGRAADNVPAFQAMKPDEQQAARVGYGDRILEAIERNKAAAPNAARELNSTKRQAESAAMALNPERLQRQVGRENTMFDTFNRALGGSRTADNLADVADLGPLADAGRAVRDAASGNAPGAVGNLFAAARPYLTGQNEATRAEIAKMLMSSDPVKALEKARTSKTTGETTRRAIEGMLRSAVRGQLSPL